MILDDDLEVCYLMFYIDLSVHVLVLPDMES